MSNLSCHQPIQKASRKGNAKNFQRKDKVQVCYDGVWTDRTKPCGSLQAVRWALHFEKYHGFKNVRIVKVD